MRGKYRRMKSGVELRPYPQVDFLIQHGREGARKHLPPIVIVALALAGLAGLTAVADPSVTVLATPAVPLYELSFQKTDGEPVTTLPVCTTSVCEELVLKAHIEDIFGNPAKRGLVIFQYCSLKGLPPNDITRPDEAPKEACEDGSATWADLGGFKVNASGDAYFNFGIVLIPRTVGFRFRYIGQGGGIANGMSEAKNFTWF